MSKIKTIEELREFALDALESLKQGKIDVAEAAATGKLCDGVISTIKTEIEYGRLTGQTVNIPFMGKNYSKQIEGKVIKKLL